MSVNNICIARICIVREGNGDMPYRLIHRSRTRDWAVIQADYPNNKVLSLQCSDNGCYNTPGVSDDLAMALVADWVSKDEAEEMYAKLTEETAEMCR